MMGMGLNALGLSVNEQVGKLSEHARATGGQFVDADRNDGLIEILERKSKNLDFQMIFYPFNLK